jgi:glyoxylase-like metal-dependent hydrolase (beta-lactamase superfamily II)
MTTHHTIQLGNVNTYLIRGEASYMLVDAGTPRKADALFDWLRMRGISAGEIGLIVITHVHFDHVGSLKGIQAAASCPVLVHETEAELLSRGEVAIPPGTRWFSRPLLGIARKTPLIRQLLRYPAVNPDILVPGEELSLAGYGFPARIIHTPGHTAGSISVLTDDGKAFVGDLASNDWPMGRGPIFNPFGEDGERMLRSWEKLLRQGARMILPAHGNPFEAERLEEVLAKRRRSQRK